MLKKERKLISIIIPAYNAAQYIAETILSVQQQSYSNWELIIIDDGSTDNTAAIVKEIAEKDKQISYYFQKNAGVSTARNAGIEKAKGAFFAFLDADDLWLPHNLEIKIQALEKENKDWLYSNCINLYKDGREENKICQTPADLFESLLLWDGKVMTAPSGLLLRKGCLEKGCRFDKNFSTAADQDFVFQLAKSFKGMHLPQITWKYRILEQSMSRNISLMEKDHIGVYRKAKQNGLFYSKKFQRQCFANVYLTFAGSWWKEGNNKFRGLLFLIRAFFTKPSLIIKQFF
jgi:glycosyltransferase involved in cell wall biosynthesis